MLLDSQRTFSELETSKCGLTDRYDDHIVPECPVKRLEAQTGGMMNRYAYDTVGFRSVEAQI